MRNITEKRILNIFGVHRGVLISASLITDRLGLSYGSVAKHLKRMVDENKVERIGVGKPWRYYYYRNDDTAAKRQVLAMMERHCKNAR